MDRFHRRYWVLPKSGGVYVESMESSLKEEERELVFASSKKLVISEENPNEESSKERDDAVKEQEMELNEEEEKDKSEESTVCDKAEASNEKVESKIDKEANEEESKSDVMKEEEKDVSKTESDTLQLYPEKVEVKKEDDEESDKKCELAEAKEVDNSMVTDDKKAEEISETKNDVPGETPLQENKPEQDNLKSDLENKESEPEQRPMSPEAKQNESKSDSVENDLDVKSVSQSPQKIWTIDAKSADVTSKEVKKEPDLKIKKEEKKDSKIKECENKFIEKMFSVKEEKKPNVNIFMPNLCDNINLDLGAKLLNSSDRHSSPNPSIPPDQNWVLHSPLFASILAGNMLFNGPLMSQRDMNGTYFNLPKNDSNNPFGPFLGLQSNALSEQIFKSFGEKNSSQKPWFSILPRMPCDESLISSPQPSRNSSVHSPHSPDVRSSRVTHSTPPPNAPPGHVASALSNLQMELMNGVPPGFFLHPFLPPQYGPTYQSTPTTCSSHHSSYSTTISHSSPMPDFGLNFNRPPAASTPNSIPTPSATPGPTSHGYATPTSRDSPSPSFAKRLMMEKQTQEYEAPLPIPPGMLDIYLLSKAIFS